jgi:hypothetical protein
VITEASLPERRASAALLRNALHDLITELQRQYVEIPPFPTDEQMTALATRKADAEYVLKILRLHT